MNLHLLVSLALGVAVFGNAQAGRPLGTDDASLLPEGACQLETWWRPSRHLHQFTLQPGCNFGGNIEWGVSVVRQRASGEPAQWLLGLQGKTVFREITTGSWGAAATLGISRPVEGASTGSLRAATLILSAAPTQPLVLHVNVGATQMASQRARANWAAAIEYAIDEHWTLVAEGYGERHRRSARHVGLRTWIQPERLQLDATIGREHIDGRPERFITLGLVWVWEKAWDRE